MRYSNELIQQIISSNDIVDVVQEHVALKKSGSSYLGLCPFHKEKTASFNVSPDKQIFYCFGCNKGGDVIKFLMDVLNIDFVSSVKLLAERARIELKDNESEGDFADIKLLIQINTEAAKFYHNSLMNTKFALDYFEKRRISLNSIRRFGLGFSPPGFGTILNHLKSLNFDVESIINSGLVSKKDNNIFDRFRNRIMFPIFNQSKKVVGFGGRVLDDSLPKYLNSPETPIFNKSECLYGINFTDINSDLILVEGYMDVIALSQSGFKNVVAGLGTAFNESHARVLKRFKKKIILLYDNDDAGQRAALKAGELLFFKGLKPRIATLKHFKDADEFLKNRPKQELIDILETSLPFIEFKIKNMELDLGDSYQRIEFINMIVGLLKYIQNRVELDVYISKISKEYNVKESTLYSELNIPNKITSTASFKPDFSKPKEDLIEKFQKLLLNLIIKDNTIVDKLNITEDYFEGEFKSIFNMRDAGEKEIIRKIPIVAGILIKDNEYNNILDTARDIKDKIDKIKKRQEYFSDLKRGKFEDANSLLIKLEDI